jgi:hypothetical protein
MSVQHANGAQWERMRLSDLGTLADVVNGGGGKLSPTTGDPGDIRKVPGNEH